MKSYKNAIKVLPQHLIDSLSGQYDERCFDRILDGYMVSRPVTVRVNTLKTDTRSVLSQFWEKGIKCDRVRWYGDALIVKNVREKEIEKLDLYQNGSIYLQSLSSMLPPLILSPRPGSRVLDMAAAPGGKTTQLAAIMNNDGEIIANEEDAIRAQRLEYNVNKQGADCVSVNVGDGRRLSTDTLFDAILLDAPCSGAGTIGVGNPLSYRFTEKLVTRSASLQLALLKKGLSLLKKGGYMVYSTCSILARENEDVISSVLSDGNVSVIPIDFEGMDAVPRLPSSLNGTLCVAPNQFYEGFFVAKLRKK